MKYENRIGKFRISRIVIDKDPDAVMAVMARCVIVRCEAIYVADCCEYSAYSPDFCEIPLGEIPPEYNVWIEEIDEQYKVSFKRVSA